MLWRYKVIGIRHDKREIELMRTFSYDKAMGELVLVRSAYASIYSDVTVELPFWFIQLSRRKIC